MDIRELHRALVDLHGQPEKAYSEDGVRQLLTTILSQNVTGEQTARAAENLFQTYPDYRAIEEADHDELAEVISAVGLMNQKARRIQRSLARIREEGISFDEEETVEGLRCIAAPVVVDGEPLGALSVSGPSQRFNNDEREAELVEAVREAANVVQLNFVFS